MRYLPSLFLVLSAALSAAGCGDYLSGPGLSDDPNNVTTLTKPGPLYLSIQQAGAGQHENAVQMHYVQQVAGINRALGVDRLVGGADFSGYGGAGLLDIHKMQQLARKGGDSLYAGIDKFADWIAQNRSTFFVSSYTPHTAHHNADLERLLRERSVPYSAELRRDHLQGMVTFLPAGDVSHRNFVTHAWSDNPIKDILVRMDDIDPKNGTATASIPTGTASSIRN